MIQIVSPTDASFELFSKCYKSLTIEQLVLIEDTGKGFSEEVTFKLSSAVFCCLPIS